MIDVIQGLVNFRASEGYGLDHNEEDHKEDKEKVVHASKTVPKERIKSILETLHQINLFSMKDRYDDYGITDQAYVTITAMTKSGRKKEVLVSSSILYLTSFVHNCLLWKLFKL